MLDIANICLGRGGDQFYQKFLLASGKSGLFSVQTSRQEQVSLRFFFDLAQEVKSIWSQEALDLSQKDEYAKFLYPIYM